MIRDRAWRRYMEERIVIRRMTRFAYANRWWRGFEDANSFISKKISVSSFIGSEINFRSKTHTTTKWDSRYKVKYSPNKGKCHWRDGRRDETREGDKRLFLKILKENGLK